jgi:hypothetical protein
MSGSNRRIFGFGLISEKLVVKTGMAALYRQPFFFGTPSMG